MDKKIFSFEGKRIAIIDDDVEILESHRAFLERRGFWVITFENPLEALEWFNENDVDVMLLDYYMDELTGKEFSERYTGEAVILLHTGESGKIPEDEMMATLNIHGYFDKKKTIEDLLSMIKSAIKTADAFKTIKQQEKKIDMLTYKKETVGNFLDEVSDQIADKLQGVTANTMRVLDSKSDEGIETSMHNIDEYIRQSREVIRAINFNTPKSRKLLDLLEFVKILNKHKVGKAQMNIDYTLDENVEISYYRNSCLVYLLIEVVAYIIKREVARKETEGNSNINAKDVIFNAKVTDDSLNIVVNSEYGFDYEEEFINKLKLLIAEEPEGFIDISVNDKNLIIRLTDVERITENHILVGKNLNDKIIEYQ